MNKVYQCYFCEKFYHEEELEASSTSEDIHVCKNDECVDKMEGNTTGYCSTYCKITGKCDDSC